MAVYYARTYFLSQICVTFYLGKPDCALSRATRDVQTEQKFAVELELVSVWGEGLVCATVRRVRSGADSGP